MVRSEARLALVLYEDDEQGTFLRHLMRQLGVRVDRYQRCGAHGDVLEQLRIALSVLRSRMKVQKNLGVLAAVDADGAPDVRRRQLDERVRETGDRTAEDRIVYVVPARNIEAWYVHLCLPEARPIDERVAYEVVSGDRTEWAQVLDRHGDVGRAARAAVAAWYDDPTSDPPALRVAREELARLR